MLPGRLAANQPYAISYCFLDFLGREQKGATALLIVAGDLVTESPRLSRPSDSAAALEAMYQLLLWLVPTLEKLTPGQKALFGCHIRTETLSTIDT